MRHSFERKHISPKIPCLSNGLPATPESAIIPRGARAPASELESHLKLIIAESQFVSGILLWFEEASPTGTAADGIGERRDGCGDDGGVSLTIKAVYSEAWGDDEGRLDALDLLLTLCSVPTEREESVFSASAEDVDRGDDGKILHGV